MSIAAYNLTPSANITISGIDISEGCSPAGFNNAIRQIMADIKEWTNTYVAPTPVPTPYGIAIGGTGQTTAIAAFNALAATGGTIGGDVTINGKFTRTGFGVHPYWGSTSATGGKMFLQAVGADPTSNPYEAVYEY